MAITNQQKNQHLLWRAAFGPTVNDYPQLANTSTSTLLSNLFKASAPAPAYIDVVSKEPGNVMMMSAEAGQKPQLRSEEEKRQLRIQSREDLKQLNITWLHQMAVSPQQLREKMSLFWHGHFACRSQNSLYQQQLLDVIRKNALGSFAGLLLEVSKSAAMLNFLNNNQNRKGHPNENFAREVMELFTMGRGNYTEQDIKEAARSFTGWGTSIKGEFIFRKNQHDDASKTVLGKSGNFTGDDVLNILLEHPQTAGFITRKVYRYFVNEQADETHVAWLAKRFYDSRYDISKLMQDIFTSTWFYDEKNIGCHIKSPVELIAGIRRALPMEIENEAAQVLLQRLLGQLLFYPPNVAGWPGGKNWIDSSSLMLRMRIPQAMYAGDGLNMKPKDDDDQMMGMNDKAVDKSTGRKDAQMMAANINWSTYIQQFEKVPREKLIASLSQFLLQVKSNVQPEVLNSYADASGRESYIKTMTIRLMSTPEYQLC